MINSVDPDQPMWKVRAAETMIDNSVPYDASSCALMMAMAGLALFGTACWDTRCGDAREVAVRRRSIRCPR